MATYFLVPLKKRTRASEFTYDPPPTVRYDVAELDRLLIECDPNRRPTTKVDVEEVKRLEEEARR